MNKSREMTSPITTIGHNGVVLFERYAVGGAAVLVGLAIAAVSILGPLAVGMIRYRWSAYSIQVVAGQDLIHLLILVPICIAGGVLRIVGSSKSKYLLIAVGPYLIYQFALLAIAPEWAHADYAGQLPTSQNFFWLYAVVVFGGLLLTFDSLSELLSEDMPALSQKVLPGILLYAAVFGVFLSALWILQILNVLKNGVAVKAYYRAPTVFWWIRIFDLAAVVPLILISLYAFVTRRNSGGYALLLLGIGSLMLAAPAIAGSQIYAYMTVPGSGNLIEVLFFSIATLPVFPCYFYLIRHIFKGSEHRITSR